MRYRQLLGSGKGEVSVGGLADGGIEDAGGSSDVPELRVFGRIVADAAAARDEQHAGRSVFRPVHGVMAGAARELQALQMIRVAYMLEHVYDGLVHAGRLLLGDLLYRARYLTCGSVLTGITAHGVGDCCLGFGRYAADIDTECCMARYDVHSARLGIEAADCADDRRLGLAARKPFGIKHE